MENLELLNDLRSGNLSNIKPQSRAEEILLAIHEKMDRTVDTSKVTVTADTLLEGVTAHDAEGNPITGTHTDEGFKYAITDFSYFCEDGRRTKDIKTLDTSNGTNFSFMFYDCSSLTSIPSLDTSNGTYFGSMFGGCKSLTAIPQLDTSNGTSFTSMFRDCSSLTSIPSLDTSNGTGFSYMFIGCNKLTSIPALDTSNGTSFAGMFQGCSSLTSIPSLDTSNGTGFMYMFYGCDALTSIPELDTSKGTNFIYMFFRCTSLKDVTFTGTINVTGVDLSYSPLLTKASITSLVNALSSTATGQSVTVSQTAVNNAFTTEEWNALKATKSNWTIELKDSE